MLKGENAVLLDAKANPCGLARGKDVEVARAPPNVPEGGGGEKNLGGGGDAV